MIIATRVSRSDHGVVRRPIMATALLVVLFSSQVIAAGFETLLMPGRVIEGHADIQGDCAACHDVQSDLPQAVLCISCHEEVGDDRAARTGFHGRFGAAQGNECVVCHTEHEGRDADIVQVAVTAAAVHAATDQPVQAPRLDRRPCGDVGGLAGRPDSAYEHRREEAGGEGRAHVSNRP